MKPFFSFLCAGIEQGSKGTRLFFAIGSFSFRIRLKPQMSSKAFVTGYDEVFNKNLLLLPFGNDYLTFLKLEPKTVQVFCQLGPTCQVYLLILGPWLKPSYVFFTFFPSSISNHLDLAMGVP